jgi:hypothetical protein
MGRLFTAVRSRIAGDALSKAVEREVRQRDDLKQKLSSAGFQRASETPYPAPEKVRAGHSIGFLGQGLCR